VTKLVHQISETDAAWLAGLIDGEGYVGVRKLSRVNDYQAYQPALSVVMTHEPTILKLHEMFPGGAISPRLPEGNRKMQYTWRPTATQVILDACELIQPYCITKQDQVKFLIEICKIKLTFTRGKRVTDPYYLALCEKLSTMNLRGAA